MVKVESDPGASLGRYQLLFLLGQGGMGEVHLAKLTGAAGFEKLCIVKTILPQMQADPQFVERFHHEARVLVQLNHSNIAQVYDMGEVDQTLYMAIEYVPGVDLARVESRVRQARSVMPIPIAVYLAQQVAEALGYAHRKTGPDGSPLGIVHRDVSPQNVMVSYEGELKVIDFGLAKSAGRSQHTLPQTVMGKLGYMSPEQAMARPVDHRSDIFSAGIIAWETLAGRPLYAGGTMGEMVAQMAFPNIPPIRSVRPEISPTLEQIVMRALQADPAARYSRADEFARSLNELAVREGLTVGAEEVGNYVRSMCPEEFAAERQLQSKLSMLRRKVSIGGDTEPEVPTMPSIEGTIVRQSRPGQGAEPEPLTPAQRALSVQLTDPAGQARARTVVSTPGRRSSGGAPVATSAATPAPVTSPGYQRPASRPSLTPAPDEEDLEQLAVPKSKLPLVLGALVALAVLGGGAAFFLKGPSPAPVVAAPVAVAPPPVAAEPVVPQPVTPPAPVVAQRPPEPARPEPVATLGEVEPAGPLALVHLDGEEALIPVPPGQKPPFREADAVLLVGEVPAGSKKAPLYAHATVVDVKPTLVKIFKADGVLSPSIKLYAVRDPTPRSAASPTRREPAPRPTGARPVEVARAEPAPATPAPVEPAPEGARPSRVEPSPVVVAPVDPAMNPAPFPGSASGTPAGKPVARQLVGTIAVAANLVQIINASAFDYTDCTVRLTSNRTAKVPLVSRGAWVGVRPAEFRADSRAPDPQFAAGWSSVFCAEGTGYFHTTSR
jgi:serine/threonine-protein kinase